MKLYNFKSKDDVINFLNERVGNNWEGEIAIINEEINNCIRFNAGGARWFDENGNTTFAKVVSTLYKNRQAINNISI